MYTDHALICVRSLGVDTAVGDDVGESPVWPTTVTTLVTLRVRTVHKVLLTQRDQLVSCQEVLTLHTSGLPNTFTSSQISTLQTLLQYFCSYKSVLLNLNLRPTNNYNLGFFKLSVFAALPLFASKVPLDWTKIIKSPTWNVPQEVLEEMSCTDKQMGMCQLQTILYYKSVLTYKSLFKRHVGYWNIPLCCDLSTYNTYRR